MNRKLVSATLFFAMTAVFAVAFVALSPGSADAFSVWGAGGPNCSVGACHGNNFGGFGSSLHDLHTPMVTDCNTCHPSGGGSKPVEIGHSDSNTKPSCAGCHTGAGLREHHRVAAGETCVTASCHSGDGAPAAENVLPPYYGTALVNGVDDPCNPTASADTNENWDNNFVGLDNDGDNLYDGDDPDCQNAPPPPPPAGGATYDFKTGVLNSPETKVGSKAYNVDLTKQAVPGFILDLTKARKVSPTGSPTCTFDGGAGVLDCPVVTVGSKSYHVILDKLPGDYTFELRSARKN